MTDALEITLIANLLRQGNASSPEQQHASARLAEIAARVGRTACTLDEIVRDAQEDELRRFEPTSVMQFPTRLLAHETPGGVA